MNTETRQSNLALVFVGIILILAASGLGVVLRFTWDRAEARSAASVFDGLEPTPGGKTLYCGEGSICKAVFTEPFETVVFLFRDGSFLTYSTHDDKIIDAPISVLADEVINSGRFLEDCLLIVHNHFSPVGFTQGDETCYEFLKRKGFRGVFGIYYPATGRFLGIGG